MFKKKLILICILLLIPFISAITITDTNLKVDNLNYQIFVNDSITCSSLKITNNSINIYNISTKANFTNTGLVNSVLSFYGLQTAFPNDDIRWDNGTILTTNSDNINVTIPTSRRIELGDFSAPVITIINPISSNDENSNPVNFVIRTDESSTCVYHLDNEYNNFTMTNSGNVNFSATYSLQNGIHTAIFYCTDSLSHTSSESVTFTFYGIGTSSGASAGGSGGTATGIKLDKLELKYGDWIKGKKNQILVYVYDIDGNLFDPDYLNIDVDELVFYEEKEVRLNEGEYQGEYLIKEDIDEVNIKIVVEDYWKTLEEDVTIQLKEPTKLEELKNNLKIKVSKLDKFVEQYKIYIVVFIMIVISLLIFLLILKRKKE
ncbi:MAG: hypothetical protein KKB88_01190 [Nanoarchaeota archaeon]|nr:hypothetical protein [Nanoarchaeota archaeon]